MENNWISVEDRLPEDGQLIVVFDPEEPIQRYRLGWYEEVIGCIVDGDDCAYWGDFWMPMPPPPQQNNNKE